MINDLFPDDPMYEPDTSDALLASYALVNLFKAKPNEVK